MRCKIGDVVILKERYRSQGNYGIIISIDMFDGPGWSCYDYTVMTELTNIIRITEGCIELIITN